MAVLKYKKQDGTYSTLTNIAVKGVEPVQTTGTSVTDVMSQNAVTVELASKLLTSDFNTYSGVTDTLIGGKASQGDLNTLSGTVTSTTVTGGTGLSGGGRLGEAITLNIAMPSTYSSTTYTTGETFTSDEPIVYAQVRTATDLNNQVCPVSVLADGQQCNVVYFNTNATGGTKVTVAISNGNSYFTPDGTGAIEIKDIPGQGYGEVNYINIKGVIFVRGV